MRTLLVILLVSLVMTGRAQEICDNAIDDDADGLIDLNDTTDCFCTTVIIGGDVASIIPNPSFEDHICLPQGFSQLNCAETWQQATLATTDYYRAESFMPTLVPQPLPNGNGCVGSALARNFLGPGQHYLEYVGACLQEPLLSGAEYSLQFQIAGCQINGFTDTSFPISVGPVDITLFGLTECPTFPVGSDFGCPQGWEVLGTVAHQPDGTWHQTTITFTPAVDIHAVMVGGPCEPPADYDLGPFVTDSIPYFFYDDLTLARSDLFTIISLTGSDCTNDLVLTAHPDSSASSSQWYQGGVAITGQTDSVLDLSLLDLPFGEYQFLSAVSDTVCSTVSIMVIEQAAVFPHFGASPVSGCPPLSVDFSGTTSGDVAGCSWVFGDGGTSTECDPMHLYSTIGTFDVTLMVTMSNDCAYDTTYNDLIRVAPPPTASFTVTPQPAPSDVPVVTFTDGSSADVITWQWDFNTVPPFTSSAENPVIIYPSEQGAYPVTLVVTNGYGCTDTAHATVIVLPTGELDMPNVFSPNGDGQNDRFSPLDKFPGKARLSIFNRWGQQIFSTTNMAAGWNGTDAPAGTYYWIVENLGDTGNGKVQTGHLTLLH